jgi:UDP-galactopyranose mutase
MIDEFYGYRFGELEYRTLRFETEDLPQENYQGNAVVNYTEAEIPYTRIIEHKHFEFGCQGGVATDHTVVTREYPAAWKHGDEPYYPMNDEKNNALFAQYKALAESEKNVIFGGRLGMYKYFDMHHVIAEALACAKKEVW